MYECRRLFLSSSSVEGLVKTGPTGTNVMDVRVVLAGVKLKVRTP
jgi:hypothetical protein